MAITIKSMNGIAALKKLGVADDLLKTLVDNNFIVNLTSKKFVFSLEDVTYEFDISLNDIQALSNGSLETAKLQVIKIGVTQALKQMFDAQNIIVKHQFQNTPTDDSNQAAPTGTLGKLPPLSPGAKQALATAGSAALLAEHAKSKAWAPYPKAELNSGKQVPLREATRMYQPVIGTSPGSRYYLIAGSQEFRVAVKLQDHQLSIRVEGPGFKNIHNALNNVGFTVNGSKGYASVHLEVGNNKTIRNKALGAILMGLGLPIETPFPDLNYLEGAKP